MDNRVNPSKHWCFTLNDAEDNLEHSDVIEIWGPHCSYLVFQEELGENGTKHYQGYAEFKNRVRPAGLTKCFKPHWEKRKGTRQQARDYCMKEDTRVAGPWEHGEWTGKSGEQGKRTDLIEVAQAIKERKSHRQIFEEYPASTLRYTGNIRKLQTLYRPPPPEDLKVVLFYGLPGTGKTRYFWESFPEGWSVPVSKDVWFDGYDGEKEVIIDDFAGGIGLSQFLQILDRYCPQVQVKGGFTWFRPERIYVTSNVHPWAWYDYSKRASSYEALKRRFTAVFEFGRDGDEFTVIEKDKEDFFENQKVGEHYTKNAYKGPRTWDEPQ